MQTYHSPGQNHQVQDQPLEDRSLLRQILTVSLPEVVSGFFQLSQQAGAITVHITTTDDSFTVFADRPVVAPTVEAWNRIVWGEGEHPLNGVSFQGLLAVAGITSVSFRSGPMAITIDPIRWWHDPAYFQGWPQLLTHCNSATEGFEILVVCAADIVNRVENFLVPILERTVKRGLEYEPNLAQPEPARGYEGWLKILLNQEPVNTQPPLRTRFAVPVVETSYLGNRLTIGFSDQPLHRNSIGSINWYGQVITVWRNAWFGFYCEVKVGNPFNFESPRCLSIAGDDAWTSFTAFIKEAIRQYLFDPENRSQVKPEWIQALGFWNAAALADCPYWLVSEYQPVSFPRGYDELEAYAPAQLRRPDEFPFLLHPWVNLAVPKSTTDSDPLPEYEFGSADYGIDSFIPLLKAQGITPFNVLQGPRPENAAFHVVWWKPGPDLQREERRAGEPGEGIIRVEERHEIFCEPGMWAVLPHGQNPREQDWKPLGDVTVFVFGKPDCLDVLDVEGWLVGTCHPLAFVEQYGWAGFDPDNDNPAFDLSPEAIKERYRASLDHLVRVLIGNTIKEDFTVADLLVFTGGAKPVRVEYEYGSAKLPFVPTRIVVTDMTGNVIRLNVH